MAGLRFAPRSLGITIKVFLWALGILIIAFLIIAALSWVIAGEQARTRVQDETETALVGLEQDYDQQSRDVQTLGKWLADQPALAEMVRSRDGPGLTRYLQPWTDASLVDSLTVADDAGTVITSVRSDQPNSQGDSVLDYRGMPDALKGLASSDIEQDKSGQLQARFILPIHGRPGQNPIGALIVAFFLDGNFIKHISNKGLAAAAIVYQDRLIATTLTDRQGKMVLGRPVPPEVMAAERAGRRSGPVQLETDSGPYLFQFAPLQAPGRGAVGMFGIGAPTASIEAQRATLFNAFAVGLILAALAVADLSALFARALTSPIRSLDAAARAMAQGDLSRSIELKNKDELGDLARQLDAMRQQLARALQASALEKSYAEGVIQSMGVPVFLTDPDARVLLVNPSAQMLLRANSAELVGRPWQDLLMPAPDGSPSPLLDSGLSAPGPIVHAQRRLHVRPELLLDVISAPVQVQSQLMGYVHVALNLTGQATLLRAKDEFTMNLAHELRGPTAALRAVIDLLAQDYETVSRRDARMMIHALERAVIRFQGLVENLIDIGNIQVGRFQVRPVVTELDGIVQQAAAQVANQLKANEQTLELQTTDGLVVMADPRRVIQVLVNLLTNASKYSPEQQAIRIETSREGNMVVVAVADRGPGIAPEDRPHLFERFYRAKRTEEEGIGLGLGLALSKAIVEAHGGQISFTTETGKGSIFWITLPLVERRVPSDGGRAADGAGWGSEVPPRPI